MACGRYTEGRALHGLAAQRYHVSQARRHALLFHMRSQHNRFAARCRASLWQKFRHQHRAAATILRSRSYAGRAIVNNSRAMSRAALGLPSRRAAADIALRVPG